MHEMYHFEAPLSIEIYCTYAFLLMKRNAFFGLERVMAAGGYNFSLWAYQKKKAPRFYERGALELNVYLKQLPS